MDILTEDLCAIVGRNAVLTEADELLVYECDGLPQHKYRPRAVVFPESTEEVAEVLCLLASNDVPFAPRGAGTGLSGGALALNGGVTIELARMRRLLKLDPKNRFAVVQTGMVNAHLSRAALPYNLHYVPDPSSQMACTIGGNIAENAGGIHCLKYGTTVDHVLAARVVLAGGEIVDLEIETPGYDLLGVLVGSEGTFGIATEATLRLSAVPDAVRTLLAVFSHVDDASRAVSAIIAAGLVPAALEMMDGAIIRAVEASVFAAGIPLDVEAALIVELDGLEAGLDEEAARVESICYQHRARDVRLAADEQERKKLWAARKGAFGAMGRISPDTMIQDAVVPRSRLPEVLAATYRIGAKYGLRVANVFHAGDGNLHPFICFDARHAEEVERVKEASREVMETCVNAGGSITGEHGVGFDKRDYLPLIFTEDDMDTMLRLRSAFDPTGLCNPGKIIPTPRTCSEGRATGPGRRNGESQTPGTHIEAGYRLPKVLSSLEVHSLESTAAPPPVPSSAQPRLSVAHPPRLKSSNPQFDPAAAHSQLASIVGADNVAVSARQGDSPAPSLEVTPASAAEVCETLRLALSEGWSVFPAGAGTWLDVGNSLRPSGVIISTSRMHRIIEHEPADLVATTEAGVTLDTLNEELSRRGQWLPVDPPDDGRATVGGVVATGMNGAQGYGYGATRGFVIGMRVALADGRIVKAGGRVVKNVAGYDLCKLFTGSYGSLCLILELTFKLRPIPADTATIVTSGSLDSLLRASGVLFDARLLPVAVQLLSPGVAKKISASKESDQPALLVRYAGTPETVAYQAEETTKLLRSESSIEQCSILRDDAAHWRGLAALALKENDALVWRAKMFRTELGEFLKTAMNEGAPAFSSAAHWHACLGSGRLRVVDGSSVRSDACATALERMRAIAHAAGGTFIIESAPMEVKNSMDVWGDVGSKGALMSRVKNQLDPNDMLSPGRF